MILLSDAAHRGRQQLAAPGVQDGYAKREMLAWELVGWGCSGCSKACPLTAADMQILCTMNDGEAAM